MSRYFFFLLRDYLAKKLKEQRQVFFNDNMAVVLINNTNKVNVHMIEDIYICKTDVYICQCEYT